MNETLVITVIALVAVVMWTSIIVPALAHDVPIGPVGSFIICPPGFNFISVPSGQHPDHNANSFVCNLDGTSITIDDLPQQAG